MGHPLINSILRMSLAVILGSGGHTSELLKIISNLNLYFNKADNKSENLKSHPHRLVIFGDGDTLSVLKYKRYAISRFWRVIIIKCTFNSENC